MIELVKVSGTLEFDTPSKAINIDKTLTKADEAAEAKAVGEALSVKADTTDVENKIAAIPVSNYNQTDETAKDYIKNKIVGYKQNGNRQQLLSAIMAGTEINGTTYIFFDVANPFLGEGNKYIRFLHNDGTPPSKVLIENIGESFSHYVEHNGVYLSISYNDTEVNSHDLLVVSCWATKQNILEQAHIGAICFVDEAEQIMFAQEIAIVPLAEKYLPQNIQELPIKVDNLAIPATPEMTQFIGKNTEGKLVTKAGGGGEYETAINITIDEATAGKSVIEVESPIDLKSKREYLFCIKLIPEAEGNNQTHLNVWDGASMSIYQGSGVYATAPNIPLYGISTLIKTNNIAGAGSAFPVANYTCHALSHYLNPNSGQGTKTYYSLTDGHESPNIITLNLQNNTFGKGTMIQLLVR